MTGGTGGGDCLDADARAWIVDCADVLTDTYVVDGRLVVGFSRDTFVGFILFSGDLCMTGAVVAVHVLGALGAESLVDGFIAASPQHPCRNR